MEGRFEHYIKEISQYKILTKEEQKDLIIKIKNGDQEAFNILFHSQLKLVVGIAKQFFPIECSLTKMDAIQEGNLGLIHAIEKYELEYLDNVKFSTYAAWWIKQTITRAIYNNGYVIRIPVHKYGELKLYENAFDNLFNKFKRNPTIEELAIELKMTKDNVLELSILRDKINLLSLNNVIFDNSEKEYILNINSQNEDILDTIIKNEEKEYVDELVDKLTEKQKRIILVRYGFIDGEFKGYQEASNLLNYKDRRNVEIIERKVLEKLKQEINVGKYKTLKMK